MNLDDMPELAFMRLSWQAKLALLRYEAWHLLRRLLRREHRYYLVLDGKPLAKFTRDVDHLTVMAWLIETHKRATEFGVQTGREAVVAQIRDGLKRLPDIGTAGPS